MTSIKLNMFQFKAMVTFIQNRSSVGYINVTDLKGTNRGLYRAMRREFIDGNRAGVIYSNLYAYFDSNLDQTKPLIKVKGIESSIIRKPHFLGAI